MGRVGWSSDFAFGFHDEMEDSGRIGRSLGFMDGFVSTHGMVDLLHDVPSQDVRGGVLSRMTGPARAGTSEDFACLDLSSRSGVPALGV